jgi:hypothetical protein
MTLALIYGGMCCDNTCIVSSFDTVVNNDVTSKLTNRLFLIVLCPIVFGRMIQDLYHCLMFVNINDKKRNSVYTALILTCTLSGCVW